MPAPWKNGAGSTRELWRLDDAEGMLIRISVAEITGAQPFSRFPGIDRVILQLEGPPMMLVIDGEETPLALHRPQPFAGEAAVDCRLAGPGRALDLNLMGRRGAWLPSMTPVALTAGESLSLLGEGGEVQALLALAPCRLSAPHQLGLSRYDLLLADAGMTITAEDEARLILLTATPLAGRAP